MITLPIYIINAFTPPTSLPALNCGNPAAIVLLTSIESAELSDKSRQALAQELNLAETAYVTRGTEASRFKLRWFTPKVEVELCGHATLAAAAALVRHGWVLWGAAVAFETLSGELMVETPLKEGGKFRMKFPALYTKDLSDGMVREKVVGALGVQEGRVERVLTSQYDLVVIVKEGEDVRGLKVNTGILKEVEEIRGVILGAREGEGYVCRFFAPRVGVDEDAVTGSAHCVLATVFVKVGEEVQATQVSERGGWVGVRRPNDRVVELSGSVRTVICGAVEI